MTTRRTVLRLAGALPAAALFGACQPGQPGPSVDAATRKDLLLVRTSAGLALVDTSDARMLVRSSSGISAWDGSSVASTATAPAGTRVEVRARSGELSYGLDVAGALTARVVAAGGRHLALATGSATGSTPYRPVGRPETTIVVAGPAGERARYTLPGCVEPEVFTTEGDVLYVLDYLPPRQPERYRVRMLDLATGSFGQLLTRDKRVVPLGAEEEMRGQGRQAVYAEVQSTLFTLYTHQPDHAHTRDLIGDGARDDAPHVHAFVHSLNLAQRFAYCIDLPAPFGEGSAEGHAIALSAAGGNPFVVDATSGTIARLNGSELTVDQSIKSLPGGAEHASAVISADGAKLFVSTGSLLHVVSTSDLAVKTQWTVAAPVRGLAATHDGAGVWVGQNDGAVALDASSGRQLATVAIPGLIAIEQAAG